MATTKITASGVVFPDGTTQTTATLTPGPTGASPPGPPGATGPGGYPIDNCPPPPPPPVPVSPPVGVK